MNDECCHFLTALCFYFYQITSLMDIPAVTSDGLSFIINAL